MRLIVDTNRIIAALIKDSYSRKIITHLDAQFCTVNFSENEILKYKLDILRKANLNELEFNLLLEKLKFHILMLNDELVNTSILEARKIMDKIDPKDTVFIAAALVTGSDIWSDDQHFQKQNKVKIWKTVDLVKISKLIF